MASLYTDTIAAKKPRNMQKKNQQNQIHQIIEQKINMKTI